MSLLRSRRRAARWLVPLSILAIAACGGGNAGESGREPTAAVESSTTPPSTDGGGGSTADDSVAADPTATDATSGDEPGVQRFSSALLGRDYPYTIYLPPGYDESTDAYPALYLLHGSFSDETEWLESGRIASLADRLIADGTIPPVVIVMPGSESWWIDGYNEPAESALLNELIPHIEASWRVDPAREARLLGGVSAGGYGAVNLMLEHPDRFGAVLALAPAVYRPQPPADSSAYQHPSFLDASGNFDAAFWENSNYLSYLEGYAASGDRVPLFIGSGDDDVFDIAYHAAVLHQDIGALQPESVEFRVIDGGHDWETWRTMLPEALAFVLATTVDRSR